MSVLKAKKDVKTTDPKYNQCVVHFQIMLEHIQVYGNI